VIVYGRITSAEFAVHTIALDGRIDEEARSDSVSQNDVCRGTRSPSR
jgi:hypothetical protein